MKKLINMRKLAFYIMLSVITVFVFFLFRMVVDRPHDNSLVNDFLPKGFRLAILKSNLPTGSTESEGHTFVIGTSHVTYGFNQCSNTSLSPIFEPSMSGKVSIDRAKSIMWAAYINNVKKVDIVVEVTLIESSLAQLSNKTVAADYVVEGFPIALDFVKNYFGSRDLACGLQYDRVYDEKHLEMSIVDANKLDTIVVSDLFLKYKDHLNEMLEVCELTDNARITLVSLPIHPELYSVEKVANAFTVLEKKLSDYLATAKVRSSCNISYFNLTALGGEFPEPEFWLDPGHFRSEVGDRVLEQIALFHQSQQQ